MKLSDGNALFLPLPLRSFSFRVAIPSTCRLVAIIVDDRRVPRNPVRVDASPGSRTRENRGKSACNVLAKNLDSKE